MTSEIKPTPDADLELFARIAGNAYPMLELGLAESIERFIQRLTTMQCDPLTRLYGLYRAGQLLGGMRLFDFTMNVFNAQLPVGSVGLVAVDIAHKKQQVARELIDYFLRSYRERGATLATLYPFRPDFYKKMGFGYGTKLNQYRVPPISLPDGGARERVRLLTNDGKPALAACYQRYFAQSHGMIAKRPTEVDYLFDTPENRVAGYVEDNQVRGYFVFQFKRGRTFIQNDIEIREFIYETPEAQAGLLAFLNSQADQIQTVIINTHEEYFHHLLADPRNDTGNLFPHAYHESHGSGVGLMYRVIDTAGLFRSLSGHNFGRQSCRIKITIADSFLPANAGSVVVAFEDGHARVSESATYEVEIGIDVAEFSPLVLGVTPFKWLCHYRLATISDPSYVPLINRLFLADEKPACCTRF